VLRQHPEVDGAAVVMREDEPGNKRLVGYFVGKGEVATEIKELWRFLRDRLPEYMVPAVLVPMDGLPLTPSGKVDQTALPAPGAAHPDFEGGDLTSRTPTEAALAKIWGEVLGLEHVGINHNFFELGGHSLLAIKVVSRVRDAFQIELPVRRIFEMPTIAQLAEEVEEVSSTGANAPAPDPVPLQRDKYRIDRP
jgi:acyl carrier protein